MLKEKDLKRKVPEIWCASSNIVCGYYNLRKQFLSALSEYMNAHNLNKEDVIGVSGIGCSGRFTSWQDLVTAHTTHGNAANLAQGAAMMRTLNNKKGLLYCISGDGDALAIGRSNFQNLCHTNSDVTYLILNNSIYAMTSGQTAPTTHTGVKTVSAPYGNLEKSWDPILLALMSGATFVARVSSYPKESKLLRKMLYEAFEHEGTSIVEVISPCQTQNPKNKRKKLADLEKEYLDSSIDIKVFENHPIPGTDPVLKYVFMKDYASTNYKKGIITGLIHKSSRKSYSQLVNGQKSEVRKLYSSNDLSSNLEKLLKSKKIESL